MFLQLFLDVVDFPKYSPHTFSYIAFSHTPLSFDGLQILVLDDGEALNRETVRIVIASAGVEQSTCRYQTAFRHIAGTDDHLLGICPCLIGIAVEVANYAVHLQHLIDVACNDTVVVTLLGKVRIVVVGTLVRQQQGTFHIMLDGTLVR